MHGVCHMQQDWISFYTAEELAKEFYDPKAVQEALEKYVK